MKQEKTEPWGRGPITLDKLNYLQILQNLKLHICIDTRKQGSSLCIRLLKISKAKYLLNLYAMKDSHTVVYHLSKLSLSLSIETDKDKLRLSMELLLMNSLNYLTRPILFTFGAIILSHIVSQQIASSELQTRTPHLWW